MTHGHLLTCLILAVFCGAIFVPRGSRSAEPSSSATTDSRALPTWREEGEAAATSWKIAGGDAKYRVERHERSLGGGRIGQWAEEVQITAGNGTQLYAILSIPPCHIIPECQPRIWLKAERAGVQFVARVVFPRAIDPLTEKPLTSLIVGGQTTTPGTWEQVTIDNLPVLVERQARVWRTKYGATIDLNQPYLDLLLLNLYTGTGTTQITWDGAEILGFETPPQMLVAEATPGVARTQSASGIVPDQAIHPAQYASASTADPTGNLRLADTYPPVGMAGSVLLVNNRPFFPRVIEYRGENFTLFKQWGFHAVRLAEIPTNEQLAAARQAGIWLVAPPPAYLAGPTSTAAATSQPANNSPANDWQILELGPEWDCVLAWSLGDSLSTADFPAKSALIRQLRQADKRRQRPILGHPREDIRLWSRQVELLGVGRWPLGTSLELADFPAWLQGRALLARPGTPYWTVIATQPASSLITQARALTGQDWSTLGHEPAGVRLQTLLALGAGTRGLEFASSSRLDANDPATRLRLMSLRLLNQELELLEPWLAAGSFAGQVNSSDPHVQGMVLQYNTSKMLIATRISPGAQQVPQTNSGAVRFVVPGIPESFDVLELQGAGLERLKTKRITGGLAVTLENFTDSAFILLTPDPVVVNNLKRRTGELAGEGAELHRQFSAQLLSQTEQLASQLPILKQDESQSQKWLAAARMALDEADRAAQAGNRPAAYNAARRGAAACGELRHSAWERGRRSLGSQVASPFCGMVELLPVHWKWLEGLRGTVPLDNRLSGGDMELLAAMLRAGWRNLQPTPDRVACDVNLLPDESDPKHAGNALLMTTRLKSPQATGGSATSSTGPGGITDTPTQPGRDSRVAAVLLETTPLLIVSPPIAVAPGEWICIRGKVKIPRPITGSVDGLMIVDSLGGEALAERFGQTNGWEEFVLYRIVPAEISSLTLTFALTGVGDAWIDEVSVRGMGRQNFSNLPLPPGEGRGEGSINLPLPPGEGRGEGASASPPTQLSPLGTPDDWSGVTPPFQRR
ncbi:MAG: hypothetical protein SFX18_12710 [Pirellulales bacterium]|nr:hypothetical protein [Pirellulales bacterium]